MISTGWTWDEALDQLTTPRMEALHRQWKRWPPVHKLLAVFIGYKPPEEIKAQQMTPEMADWIIKHQGGVLISGDDLRGG